MTDAQRGRVLSIQVGRVQPFMVGGRKLMSAMGKTAVTGPVQVGPLGLAGDEQSDLSVHGGLSKAVYALPAEHLLWWQTQRQNQGVSLFDEPLAPGHLGENLSLEGLRETEVFIGDVLEFAQVSLRVTQPREPCSKFCAVLGYPQAAKEMVQSGRSGFYLAVDRPGVLQPGEAFELVPGQRSISVREALLHKAAKHAR